MEMVSFLFCVGLLKAQRYRGTQWVWIPARRTPGIFCRPSTSQFHDRLQEEEINTSQHDAHVPEESKQACVSPPLSLTFFPVVALHLDPEDEDLLPLHLVIVAVDVGDGDAPGWQVPMGAWHADRLSWWVVLLHDSCLLHLQECEETGRQMLMWKFTSKESYYLFPSFMTYKCC